MAGSLEEKVEQELPPFDEFVELFSGRYRAEQTFRNMVNQYMKISGLKSFSLGVGKHFFPEWYQRETGSIVREYATRIYSDMQLASELENDQKELERIAAEERLHAKAVARSEIEAERAGSEVVHVAGQSDAVRSNIEQSYIGKISAEQRAAERQAEEIRRMTDAAAIAKERLSGYVRSSPLLNAGASGDLAFDEKQIEHKLEDVLLEEVLSELAQEGNSGFMAGIKHSYDGLIAHYAEIDDLSELPLVDWHQSIIYSRAHGYKYPQFPYLISGKPEEAHGRTSIDTALSLDISGSMKENNRFKVAQKTALALSALMRRLNKKNNTYLSVYNYHLEPVTSLKLLREVKPDGGTHTELALDWLVETLKDSGPAIAYLITDGRPNHLDATIKSARKFRDYQNIMLRIFLIDGDLEIGETVRPEETIRQIGRAAGPLTKVIPVKNYQLATGMLKDLSKVFKGMYAVDAF